MMIYFECKTNTDYPYVNSATFIYKGMEVTIDRDSTYYTYEDGWLSMDWESLYICEGDSFDYDIPADFPKYAILKEVCVEDDAPDGYEFTCTSYEITD